MTKPISYKEKISSRDLNDFITGDYPSEDEVKEDRDLENYYHYLDEQATAKEELNKKC